jgi:hypothetical protein
VRVPLEPFNKLAPKLQGRAIWIDAGLDALERLDSKKPQPQSFNDYLIYLNGFKSFSAVTGQLFTKSPDKKKIQDFIFEVLDRCIEKTPKWISVPQLPHDLGTGRNKINRLFAEAAGKWKIDRKFAGILIVPLIITHQQQIKLKGERDKRRTALIQAVSSSGADAYWAVESSLSDQDGSGTFETSRFPSLIDLHQELCGSLPNLSISVAGPYWGMNLVLWAKGLVTHFGTGLGNSYQYHVPGGHIAPGKVRIAIPPLRRWAISDPELEPWLAQSLEKLDASDPAHAQFSALLKDFTKIRNDNRAQTAKFYREWMDKLALASPQGRSLALFQDVSTAYVTGKGLPDLPSAEGTARRPERIAKQLMMVSL